MKKQYNKKGQKEPGSSATNVRRSERTNKKKGQVVVPRKQADKKRVSPSLKLKVRTNKAGVKMTTCSKVTEDRGKQPVSDMGHVMNSASTDIPVTDMPPVINSTSTEIPPTDMPPATSVGLSEKTETFWSRSIPTCKFVPEYLFDLGDISWASQLKRENMWPFFNLEETTYPELVREFYANLVISEEDPICAVSTVKGKKIYVTVEKLAEVLNVPAEGRNVMSLSKAEQEEAYKSAIDYAHVKGKGRASLNANGDLSADNRLLHHIISYMVLPRSGSYNVVHKNDIILIVDILKGNTINLPAIVFSEIVRSVKIPLLFSPYGSILTRLCQHFGVEMKYSESSSCAEVSLLTLKLMKIQFDPFTNKLVRVKQPAPSRNVSSTFDDMLSRQRELESKVDELVKKTSLRDKLLDAREKRLDRREEKLGEEDKLLDDREKRLDRREEKLDAREKRLEIREGKLDAKILDINVREEQYIHNTETKLDTLIALVQNMQGSPDGDDKSAEDESEGEDCYEMDAEDDGNAAEQGQALGDQKNGDEQAEANDKVAAQGRMTGTMKTTMEQVGSKVKK